MIFVPECYAYFDILIISLDQNKFYMLEFKSNTSDYSKDHFLKIAKYICYFG